MSLEEIKSKIAGEAEAESGRITAGAEAEARAILERARQKAEEKKTAILSLARHQAEELENSVRIEEELKQRQERLSLKQEMLTAAFARAEGLIGRWPDQDRTAFLAGLLSLVPADFSPTSVMAGTEQRPAVERLLKKLRPDWTGAAVEERSGFGSGLYLNGQGCNLDLTSGRLLAELRNEIESRVGQLIFKGTGLN